MGNEVPELTEEDTSYFRGDTARRGARLNRQWAKEDLISGKPVSALRRFFKALALQKKANAEPVKVKPEFKGFKQS